MKRIITIVLTVLMIAAVTAGCNQKVGSGTTSATSKSESKADTAETVAKEAKSTEALLNIDDVPAPDLDKADAEYQKKAPEQGEEVAILHTNYGDISFKFFPEVAPKAVNSFKALAKDHRYDGTIFHRITKPETSGIGVVQGGDYTNFNGTGGESAFGEEFDLEVSDYLSNIEGAVAMANRGPGTNGSQFYINQINNNYLDGNYTVFGQVFDGMDVVNDIAEVKTGANDKPVNDVILESVEIYAYE